MQRTEDEGEAVLGLIRVMASTPYKSWAGCPHFGFRDFFEQARTRPDLPRQALAEANLALADLGILNFRIESIVKHPQSDRDVDAYSVTIASTVNRERTFSTVI